MAKTYSRPSKAPQAHQKFVDKSRKKAPSVATMPRREMLIIYYEDRGYNVVNGRTSKYVTMEKPGQEKKYFIGKNGGVRYGTKISDSFGLTLRFELLPAVVQAILNRRK
jgi:hypothetical protein